MRQKKSNRWDATVQVIEIRQAPIELYKLLKLANIVASGGEAKMLIEEGLVQVNGQIETRKRNKIVAGDVIEVENEKILVQLLAN